MTPSRGVTAEGKKFLWANLQRIVEKRGQTGKNGAGDTLQGGDTRVKSIKSDGDEQKNWGDTIELAETVMTKKGHQFFQRKNRGDTLSSCPGRHPA